MILSYLSHVPLTPSQLLRDSQPSSADTTCSFTVFEVKDVFFYWSRSSLDVGVSWPIWGFGPVEVELLRLAGGKGCWPTMFLALVVTPELRDFLARARGGAVRLIKVRIRDGEWPPWLDGVQRSGDVCSFNKLTHLLLEEQEPLTCTGGPSFLGMASQKWLRRLFCCGLSHWCSINIYKPKHIYIKQPLYFRNLKRGNYPPIHMKNIFLQTPPTLIGPGEAQKVSTLCSTAAAKYYINLQSQQKMFTLKTKTLLLSFLKRESPERHTCVNKVL